MACSWGRKGPCFTTEELECLRQSLLALKHFSSEKQRKPLLSRPATWDDIVMLLQDVLSDCEIRDGVWLHGQPLNDMMNDLCSELAQIIRYFAVKPPRYMNPSSDNEMSILDVQMVLDQYLRHIDMPVDFDTVASMENDLEKELIAYVKSNQRTAWARILLLHDSHWVAIYVPPVDDVNSGNRRFEYFDSYGDAPEEFVCNMISKVTKKRIQANTMRHQYDNYLCGVYCVFYIMNRIRGVKAETFSKHAIQLDTILEFRNTIQQRDCC